MNIEQYIIEIKNELKSKGYAGRNITYIEFLELYEKYGQMMEEKTFAQNVLEMTTDQYESIKKGKDKAKILKNQLSEIIKKEVEIIKKELAKDGYCGKLINYTELQLLHQKYGSQMSENKFAQYVLDLNGTSYRQVKSGKRKVYILKSLQNKALEDIARIKEILQSEGYAGKIIDYKELISLHQKYGNMLTETQFAQKVLELSSSTYLEVKNKGIKARVLKKMTNQELQKNIAKMKKQLERDGYAGKTIDYEEFQMLHQKYGNQMLEHQFAQDVLEINYSTYKTTLKKRHNRVVILKSLVLNGLENEIEEIKQILRAQGYVGKLIDYSELQRLHQLYGSKMLEYQFAQKVLEISASLYGNIKYNERKRATILKSLINNVSQDEIEKIKEMIEAKGSAGKLIGYEELQRLHQQYGSQMEEDFFAKRVLEIPSKTYRTMKQGDCQTHILCHNKKIELIHNMLLKECRWYSKEELEEICKKNKISIDKIIRQVLGNGTNMYNDVYKRVLNEKGRLWIGRSKISEQFLEENMESIVRLANIALCNLKKRYRIMQNSEDEDFIQDAIIWLSQYGGEIEKNFKDYPDILQKKIFNTISKGIRIKMLILCKTPIKTIPFNEKLKLGNDYEHHLESQISSFYDCEENPLSESCYEVMEEEFAIKCIHEMKQQIDAGESKQNILRGIEEKFGLSKKQLLEIMQYYLDMKGNMKEENSEIAVEASLQEQK